MTYAAKTGSFWKTLALVVVAVGVAAPMAGAGTQDALGRYLAAHRAASTSMAMPVSDVANSLQVARIAPAGPAPVSDNASSLQVARIAAARPTDALGRYLSTNRAPVSDNANSQMLVRSATSAPVVSTSTSSGFAWAEAGIGAGTTLLLVVLAGAGLTLVRRHRELTV